MLLNRLELQGFKSFPDKINLDFNHRITAVVGPNGSGKSNITDSIRWLLGERDARNLRGGKGEDLIFAGTESRPRVGLAQATIYFNNSSNSFPLDFKEVSISRRISRDGTSQFFINKAEVRLKDLVDILAKAKLGARGLTVINQGADDVFIKASPLERRTMIEETLGLKEYQIKKSDAVRRLQTTAFNLEKVKALIEELKPHLRSLKRQVSRYEGREELAHELRQLENNFYGGRLTKLREELSGLSKQESKLKEAIHKQELALKKVEEEFNGVSLSEPQSVKELKEVQIEREKLLIGRREIEKTAAKLEAQLEFEEKNPDSDPNNVRKAVEEIRELVKSLLEENELSLLKAGIKQVSELVEGLFKFRKVEKSPDLEKNFKKLTADLNSLDKELEALNKKENNRRQLLEGFNQNFRRAYESVERERKEFEKLREEGSRILLAKERADTRLIDLREELSQIGLSVEKLEKASMNLPAPEAVEEQALRRMFKLRSELAGIGEVDETLVKEAKETGERYEFLTHQTADLEKAVADLKSLIQELDQKIYVEFSAAIKTINEEFTKLIRVIFGGGKARLVVQEEGVDVEIALPKKKIKGLEVLSGGERSLVSIAALFSLISVSPPPFLVLDEIDAALDENNARRFSQILKEFSRKTQFVVVTHNRSTMEAADVLYGVTMSPDGTSKIVSLKLT